MEGGNPIVEYRTCGILGLLALSLGILAVRSAWFFLSGAIPLSETIGRWRPVRGAGIGIAIAASRRD